MHPFTSKKSERIREFLIVVLLPIIFIVGASMVRGVAFASSHTLGEATAHNGYYGDGSGYYGQGGTNMPAGTYYFYCAAGDESSNAIYVGEANIVFPVTYLGDGWNSADFTQDTGGDPLSLSVNTSYDCGTTVTFQTNAPH